MEGDNRRQVFLAHRHRMLFIDQFQRLADDIQIVAYIADLLPGNRRKRCITGNRGLELPYVRCERDAGLSFPLLRAYRFIDDGARIRDRCRALWEPTVQHLQHGGGVAPKAHQHRGVWSAVQRESGRHDADEDQHDQAHALLPIVRTMSKADAGAGRDQHAANPPRRRLARIRFLEQRWIAHDQLQQQQEQGGDHESDDRRDHQRNANFTGLGPVDAAGHGVRLGKKLVGQSDANDGADERVRARCRQSQPPGTKIPDDRSGQQRENHRHARGTVDLQNKFHRQQRHDAPGDRAACRQDAEKIAQARPHDRVLRSQGSCVNDCRHGIGGVMEAVDEFEA